jgi:hypothetical protein
MSFVGQTGAASFAFFIDFVTSLSVYDTTFAHCRLSHWCYTHSSVAPPHGRWDADAFCDVSVPVVMTATLFCVAGRLTYWRSAVKRLT